jgi:hypothetical protein
VRLIKEFAVGVHRHPEFGGYRFIVIVDLTPTQYRIRMSPSEPLTPDDWTKIRCDEATKAQLRKDTAPWRDDMSYASFPVDTTWQQHPAVAKRLPVK